MDTSTDINLEAEKKTEPDEDFKSDVNDACFLIPGFDEFDIAKYRKTVGMSQSEFAAEHEISLATLKKWERHASKPIFDTALKKILTDWLRLEFGKVRHQ